MSQGRVYESTVERSRPPRFSRPVCWSKYGAPVLALCGVAIGVIALTFVAVGATREPSTVLPGQLRSAAAVAPPPPQSNPASDGSAETASSAPDRTRDLVKMFDDDEEGQPEPVVTVNLADGAASAMVAVGAVMLIGSFCLVLYAFHSRGHDVFGGWSTTLGGRRTHNSRVGSISGRLDARNSVKLNSSVIQGFDNITPIHGQPSSNGRDAKSKDEIRSLVRSDTNLTDLSGRDIPYIV